MHHGVFSARCTLYELWVKLTVLYSAIVGLTRGGVAADGTVEDPAAQKSLIAFVCIYIAAFASTWGPIAWYVPLLLV